MHNFPPSIAKAVAFLDQPIRPDIMMWLKDMLAKGVDANAIVGEMMRSGMPHELAALLVGLGMKGIYPGLNVQGDERIVQRTGPQTVLAKHAEKHFFPHLDRVVRKVMSMDSLKVDLYEDFLSEDEIAHIIKLAEPKLRRSSVVGPNFESIEVEVRTSDGMFIEVGQDEVIRRIEERIAFITNTTLEQGEALQVLRYKDAQEYKPHFDFFEPQNDMEKRMLDISGNRIGTLVMYLSDVEEGGATYFPHMKLAIHPKKGSAVWFSYMGDDKKLDMRSEHAGMPVLAGEKWLMTKWVRERAIPRATKFPPGGAPLNPASTERSDENVVPFPKAST